MPAYPTCTTDPLRRCCPYQEQEALVKELTEVLQRQKTRVRALQKERAELSAQLATYHPAEQEKLRAEVGTLRERIGELASLKVSLMKPHCCRLCFVIARLSLLYASCAIQACVLRSCCFPHSDRQLVIVDNRVCEHTCCWLRLLH